MGANLTAISISILVAWAVASFLFWRHLRNWGTSEDRIFDLTFYATFLGLVAARLGYVVSHWEEFADGFLRIFALWVAPGLSLLSALIGVIATLVYLSRSYKVRLGLVLDALPVALPIAIIIGKIGSFLSQVEVGRTSTLPWAILYSGHDGLRHPVQLYEIAALAAIAIVMVFISRRASERKWPYGLLGVTFFLIVSPVLFILELTKESSVYWGATANQWILIGFFAESAGALYIRGSGREKTRALIRHIYAAISRRSTHPNTQTS